MKEELYYTNVYAKGKNGWKFMNTHHSTVPAWRMRKPEDKDLTALTPIACQEERNLHSMNAQRPTLLRVKNNTSGPIRPIWIDYDGKRDTRPDQIVAIAPSQSLDIITFVTHPFLLLDASDQCLCIFQPFATPCMIVLGNK